MEKNGIYMPNTPNCPGDAWSKFQKARFQWALVRADVGLEYAKKLCLGGLEVVVQMPDLFNNYPFYDPGIYAMKCARVLEPFASYSNIAVLDNEPNLSGERGTSWWAEQFTRWFRTVMAAFRYYDTACHWQLCFPGLCHPWTPDGSYWLQVGEENVLESEWVGIHSYWWSDAEFQASAGQREVKVYTGMFPQAKFLVLEYGDSSPDTSPARLARQDVSFLKTLPHQVHAGCKFILHGTKDWSRYFLTDEEAEALGKL